MQKNLTRGLSKSAVSMDAKTWPGPSELALLWIIGHVWPTSDMKHPVVSLECANIIASRIATLIVSEISGGEVPTVGRGAVSTSVY